MTDGRNERVNLTTWTGIAIKVVFLSYFRPELYKLYQFPLPSIAKSKKSIYNNTKFDSFGDKYLSQGLIAILRKITQVTAAEREVGERGGGGASTPATATRQSDTAEYLSQQKRSIDLMLFYYWPDIFDVGTT